ncbi:asparaginase [Azospira restricta]|uniref:asparaginase n=1 Tax=Azospira restricta TaxID=404405 RepID=UPI001EF15CAA|nr:asparaginase [Azospira restricta]
MPLIVATRGDAVESVYYGSLAVAAADGRLLAAAGDCTFPMFTRSTLKPFQALPFVADGGPAHFGFSPAQVALMCASHSGEPRHLAGVADMLARIACDEAALQCGSHAPLFYAATGRAPPADLAASPLHHNCSGKHAGFLAWCRLHGQPTATYLDPAHPLQRAIRRRLARLLGLRTNALPLGIDGCGAPNYALPLACLAQAYARLASPGAPPPLATLFAAMTGHPEMVAGEARNDLLLMQAAAGDWVAKGGADGVQALGVRSRGLGIALKIADGSPRALQTALAAILDRLGLLPADGASPLAPWRAGEIRNAAGRLTGRLLPVFELVRPGAAQESGGAGGGDRQESAA